MVLGRKSDGGGIYEGGMYSLVRYFCSYNHHRLMFGLPPVGHKGDLAFGWTLPFPGVSIVHGTNMLP